MSRQTLGQELKDWVISILIAVVLAFFIRTYIVELYLVDGPSMRPTLYTGQRLVVNKFIFHFRTPERGEVIVFRYPSNPSKDFIKRVIAIPGDTIEIKDSKVYVNGAALNEDYILNEPMKGSYPMSKIPEGHVFAMGDNRNNSEDSRFKDVGFVPYSLIKGKAILVFWPLNQMKML